MSNRWPGGLIRKTPVTPAGPLQNGAAPGMWTLAEASYWTKQGLWPIAGNFLPVEDVFSTYLYTGNGATQTITNGINLSGQGGLVWAKSRVAGNSHILTDTARGVANTLATNFDGAQNALETNALNSFNSNGFTLNNSVRINASGESTVSWTFCKAPNFFDVVTYTGNGGDNFVNHSLGVRPGFIIIKRTNASSNWPVVARTTGTLYAYFSGALLGLNHTSGTGLILESASRFTATSFDAGWIDDGSGNANAAGQPYVAYLFAHNTASDGFIQCGSFNNSGGPATVTLGWEPQWILMKNAAAAGDWFMVDNMRGLVVGGSDPYLYANSAVAENSGDIVTPTATGFVTAGLPGSTNFIYMAIRRGPMRTPTLGTSVFAPVTYTGTGSARTITTGFVTDLVLGHGRRDDLSGTAVADRLRGDTRYLETSATSAEATSDGTTQDITGFDFMTGYGLGVPNNSWMNNAGSPGINWNFRRAPGFMDVVCYTGTGSATTFNHNLGVAPELMIVKRRNNVRNWAVYVSSVGANKFLKLNLPNTPETDTSVWNNTAPTSTVFSVGTSADGNGSGDTYVAYLFASAPGVSKVGSYTGNGSSQTINCAFTTGARFVLIKRTDDTGDWYVWDSARGIVAGNDPYLALNSTAAEVTTNDSVDTDSTGFVVNQVAASNINVNAATYIFLAIA